MTYTRYLVLLMLCLLAFVLYIDRVCIGVAGPDIQKELDFGLDGMAWVHNAFALAYCLFEVYTGSLGDRYGSRNIITRVVIWWSAFTALTGAVFNFWVLLVVRFLFGAGEAGAFPNVARVVTRWFPPSERGRIRGIITMSAQLGAVGSPLLAAWMIATFGWRWTFVIFGFVGVAWAIAFFLWFCDDPRQHSWVSHYEAETIGEPTQAEQDAAHHAIPWLTVLASPNTWLMGGIMTVSAILFYFIFQWYPTYLKEAWKLEGVYANLRTSSIMLGGAVGNLLGGVMADFVVRGGRSPKWGRKLTGAGSLLGASLFFYLGRQMPSVNQATACFAMASLCAQFALPTWWSVVAEISGKHGAAMWGLLNSMGGAGQITATFVIGYVVQANQDSGMSKLEAWQPVMTGVAVTLFVGAICWLLVDATKSIVGDNPESDPAPAEV